MASKQLLKIFPTKYSSIFKGNGRTASKSLLKHRVQQDFKIESVRTNNNDVIFFNSNQPKDNLQSFVKGLFAGNLNMHWIFPYPTYINEIDSGSNEEFINSIHALLDDYDYVNSDIMDREMHINEDIIQGLKNLGLFGMHIPDAYGGLDLTNIQHALVMEALGRDLSVSVTLNSHAIASKAICRYGTEDQKQIYLPNLASGKNIAAFCLTEPCSGNDYAAMESIAILSEDEKSYVLNGDKIWVTNGGIADVFVVFAKVPFTERDGSEILRVTAFIVDGAEQDITRGANVERIGMRAANICSVSFNNVKIPCENVLGEESHGFKVAMQLLNADRYTMASAGAGMLKYLLDLTSERVGKRIQFNRPIKDQPIVQNKFYEMSKRIYIMESMAYFIAGHMDLAAKSNADFDFGTECAVAKFYSSQAISEVINDCVELAGGLGLISGQPYERMLRDSVMLKTYMGSNDVLKTYVALSGVDYASMIKHHKLNALKEAILRHKLSAFAEKIKDEFSGPTKIGLIHKKIPSFGATTKEQTDYWLEPALKDIGLKLEKSLVTFERRVYYMCTMLGNEFELEQQMLSRFSDAATNLFIMATVLSRANKSLVLGLRNRETEAEMLNVIICEKIVENERFYEEILVFEDRQCGIFMEPLQPTVDENAIITDQCVIYSDSPSYTLDAVQNNIGKSILEDRRYMFSHPMDNDSKYEDLQFYKEQLKQLTYDE